MRIQQRIRASMNIAEDNFREFGFKCRDCWDYCAKYSAMQDRASQHAISGGVNYEQMSRSVPSAWGTVGMVTLQPGTSVRKADHKQLANRGAPGLLF